MASWQAYLLDFVVRLRVKRNLRGVTDVMKARTILEGGALPLPKDVTFRPDTIGGVAGEWAESKASTKGVLLYLHGGGYFACSPKTHRPITAAYAQLGFSVFVPEYRLAPEHPYPAAIEDAEAVWHALAQTHPANTMTVSGDSAGGGLALALMLTLRNKGHALPAAAALLSPWTDLACTGNSFTSNAKRDAMFWAPGVKDATASYLGTAPATDSLASPLYASMTGLPPLLIHVGDREILRDDSTRLADRARAAGVDVVLRIWPVVPHVWQFAQFVPESRESLQAAASFLQSKATMPLQNAA